MCWFGIILSCLDNIGQFAQVIGETVGFGQIVHHDSSISFMSILGFCVTTVSEVSLCVAVWSLSFKKIIYLASESLTQVCCQYLGVPRHRTLLLDMAGYLWMDVSACALVDATSEQFKQKILQQHQNRSVDRRCAPTEQTNMNRHVRNPLRGHKAPKIGWGISGIPLHWRKSS